MEATASITQANDIGSADADRQTKFDATVNVAARFGIGMVDAQAAVSWRW
jgi:hypothetical protein